MTGKIHWRCFHCGDAFTKAQEQHARAHFGADESALPVCQMRLPGEYHLLNILRKQEDELHAFYAEDTELWRALHAQAADHAQALRREEERGFAKGVAEARDPLRAVLKVRPVNWDDDDDPEQVAAWKLVAEFVGEEPADVG